MKISKATALWLWGERYGNRLWAEDFDGGLMYRDVYNDRGAWAVRTSSNQYALSTQWCFVSDNQKIYCGWNLHHILPKANGGTNAKDNLICTNMITNDEAEDKTTFWINDRHYQIQRNKQTRLREIVWLNPSRRNSLSLLGW